MQVQSININENKQHFKARVLNVTGKKFNLKRIIQEAKSVGTEEDLFVLSQKDSRPTIAIIPKDSRSAYRYFSSFDITNLEEVFLALIKNTKDGTNAFLKESSK